MPANAFAPILVSLLDIATASAPYADVIYIPLRTIPNVLVQFVNAPTPISLIFAKSDSVKVAEVQFENAYVPILVTLLGIDIEERDAQFSKAKLPIDVTPSGIVIEVNAVHPLKALSLSDFTEDGIFKLFINVLPLKAYDPIDVQVAGIDGVDTVIGQYTYVVVGIEYNSYPTNVSYNIFSPKVAFRLAILRVANFLHP